MVANWIVLTILQVMVASAKKVANYPMRPVNDYRSYQDVTILHVRVPEQIQTVTWNFTAWERKILGISSCNPQPVNVYLKHGSYPVINPDGSSFPPNYFQRNETFHELHFPSDRKPNFLVLTLPLPGDWFAVVFNNYTDPDDDAIQQSGLGLVCATLMESSIDVVVVPAMNVIVPGQSVKKHLNMMNTVEKFKFFVPENTSLVTVTLNLLENSEGRMSPVKLDTSVHIPGNRVLNRTCTSMGKCDLHFTPSDHRWQYATVSLDPSTTATVAFSMEVDFQPTSQDQCKTTGSLENEGFPDCWATIPLMRQTYQGFFSFGFDQLPLPNRTDIPNLNVSVKIPTLMNFELNPIQDIGGTLSFEILLEMASIKDHLKQFHVLLMACVSHGYRLMPRFPSECVSSSGLVFPNQLQVNSTSETDETHVKRLHIPYPEYGQWFLILKPFCFTVDDGAAPVAVDCGTLESLNTTFIIESLPCDPTACGLHGRCTNQVDGGLLFAACNCLHGYRGWGCTDASKVTPHYELLVAALLLTLSNLFFMPAIVIAVRRKFYTEALVYGCTMFFSTFYHACDAGGGIYSFCIFHVSVLQFCDFYVAVMAMWVTIIAMANISPTLTSLAHMAGAVVIALGTEYKRTSLLMFIIPLTFGLAILVISWGLHCRRTHACYPDKTYWKFFLPPGLILISIALICFAFLQTNKNYKYVHSAWHAIMALSILLVLPQVSKKSVNFAGDDLEAIRPESHSPIDTPTWKWNALCTRWCGKKS